MKGRTVDESGGHLEIGVTDRGHVLINFNKQIQHATFTPMEAVNLARLLEKHAERAQAMFERKGRPVAGFVTKLN